MGSMADFGDFILSTTTAYLRGPKVVIREAVENTYLFGDLMVGAGMRDILQGGAKISDSLALADPGLAQTYGSGDDEFNWRNPQTLTEWSVEWRYALTHFAWTDQERGLQGTGEMTQRARFKKFKDIYDNKVGMAYQSLYNLLESLLWALPITEDMESASGEKPYSIPAFVNEQTNGMFHNDDDNANDTPSAGNEFATVEGISPETNARWRPVQQTYNSLLAADPDNLMEGMDKMMLALTYKPFRGGRDYFERSMKSKQMICCSNLGWRSLVAIMRKSQDLFVTQGRQDAAYAEPTFAGIPVMFTSALDDAALYNLANVGTTESLATLNGPRYYWLDAEYIRPVFHRDRFIKQHTVKEHPNQPFTKIVPIDVWYNLVCRSRQRLGILSPLAAVIA